VATGRTRIGDEPPPHGHQADEPTDVIVVPDVPDGSTVNGPRESADGSEPTAEKTETPAAPVPRSLPGTAVGAGSTRAARPSRAGIAARALVAALIASTVLLLPLPLDNVWRSRMSLAVIFAVIGLSVNVITGHAGQISLGHQAFVGIGAFVSAYVVARFNFGVSFMVAGLTGAVLALILGLVALRIRGLYLALITLAFGLMAENTIFNLRGFTGGGAGAPAPRPALFRSDLAYVYLCLAVLAVFLFVDWRLLSTKAGRAIVALRNDERVAATLGVNVTSYKLLAFVLAGLMAGIAGSLFAHWNQFVQAEDFELRRALIWVLMAVVGGLGSRAGVVIGSAFFALFDFIVADIAGGSTWHLPIVGDVLVIILTPLFGAFLLLLTLTLYPGGIGQQLMPVRRWLAGGPFLEHGHRRGPEKKERRG
jgi:branched-chain amino acid transport system permease protein